MMRKMHYNEGLNIKLARQLIASELEDEEDADEEMGDETEETEEISVDPPQEGNERLFSIFGFDGFSLFWGKKPTVKLQLQNVS